MPMIQDCYVNTTHLLEGASVYLDGVDGYADTSNLFEDKLRATLVRVTLKTVNDTPPEEPVDDDKPVSSSLFTSNATTESASPSSPATPDVISETTEESDPAPPSSTATPNVVANQAVTVPEMLEASFIALIAVVAVAITVEAAFLIYRRFSRKTKQPQTNVNIR